MGGWALQFDGCEYLFATADITSLPTSSDADWPSDLTLLSAALERPRGTIEERCKPLDGDVDVSGLTFRVHDVTPSSGSASGRMVVSYLGSRFLSTIAQTALTVTLSDSETVSMTVSDTSAFPSSGTLWLEQEAITYASKTGTTFATLGRGKLGTYAIAHATDLTTGAVPIVFGGFPGFEGRRAVLYRVDDSNVATVRWIGYAKNAPRLVDGTTPEAGALWEFQCDGAWQTEREWRLGAAAVAVRVQGFDAECIKAGYRDTRGSGSGAFIETTAAPGTLYGQLVDALAWHRDALTTAIRSRSINGECIAFRYQGDGVFLHIRANVDYVGGTYAPIQGWFKLGPSTYNHQGVSTGDPHYVEVQSEERPAALVRVRRGSEAQYPVDTIAGLPSSWGAVSTSDPPYNTSVRYCLLGEYSADYAIQITPSATSNSTGTTGTPSVTGSAEFIPRSANAALTIGSHDSFILDQQLAFYLVTRIDTTHWLDGLRYGVFTPASTINTGVDGRSWDWSNAATVIAATGAAPTSRTWFLDGKRTLGDFVRSQCQFNGVGLGVRRGRIAPFVLAPPLATTTTVATFTSADLVEKSTWQRNPDGIVTTIQLEGDGLSVVLNDQLAIGRYGQQRTVKLAMPGNDEVSMVTPNIRDLSFYALGRFLALWNGPTYVRKIRVALSYSDTVNVGDYVTLTEWLTPDGSGGRGPTSIVCQVIGKVEPLDAGAQSLELHLLSYAQQIGHGYAPCCKVASIATDTLTIATGYLGAGASPAGDCSQTDYAGSNLGAYAGTANDGGTGWFAVGDKVKLVKRDVTTVTQETGFTIVNVDPIAKTIKLGSVPATVVGADWWDVVFDDYGNGSAVTTHAKGFAWTGSYSTNVIGTSTDAAQVWTP